MATRKDSAPTVEQLRSEDLRETIASLRQIVEAAIAREGQRGFKMEFYLPDSAKTGPNRELAVAAMEAVVDEYLNAGGKVLSGILA